MPGTTSISVCTPRRLTRNVSESFSRKGRRAVVHRPIPDFARDMFMLSFYLRGISLIDLAHLRKTDISQGTLIYTRSKTGQQMQVLIEPIHVISGAMGHDSEVTTQIYLASIQTSQIDEANSMIIDSL